MTEVILYEHDRGFILEKLREGEFDYLDSCDEVFEADFFRFIGAQRILKSMAASYPNPRKKSEVPLWFSLASNISLRLHGLQSFSQYRYAVRCGGMLEAFGPEVGTKVKDKDSGDIRISCPGFNDKNNYPRETPCDQDFLRKFSRDSDAVKVQSWFNEDVSKLWKKRRLYKAGGYFIGDSSYLFVPDNDAYEKSSLLLFDEHNHPVDPKKTKKSDIRSGKYRWRRCYRLVMLLYVDENLDFFLVSGFRVVPGKTGELPVFYRLLDDFIRSVGPRVVRRIILDRGFLDGERISYFKKEHGVDFLIPVKRSMDVYTDAMGLLDEVKFSPWERPRPEEPEEEEELKPEVIRKREATRQKTLEKKAKDKPPPVPGKTIVSKEVGGISGFTSWSTCTVPLQIIYNRETFADGNQKIWLLLDTRETSAPDKSRSEYLIRTQVEERFRQFKCFADMTAFTSRAFSLVTSQVLFVLLTFNLIQLFLLRKQKKELANKPLLHIRRRLLPSTPYILVYCDDKCARLSHLEYSEILLSLQEQARKKALAKIRRLKREEDRDLLRYHGPP